MVGKILNGEEPEEEEISMALGEDAGKMQQEYQIKIREEAKKRAAKELNLREWEDQEGEQAVMRVAGFAL